MSTFRKSHVEKLLYDKFVVIIGDSVQRTVYKDLLCLLTTGDQLQNRHLKSKGEDSIFGDKLLERSQLTNGKWYREVRQYHTPFYLIRFYFVTRCYSDYVETILLDLSKEPAVDVLVMNSCLWDVSRYGHRGMSIYKENLQILFSRFKTVLPPQCLTIWHAAMPVGRKIQTRGFLLPDIAFLENILSLQVREGNFYACQVASEYGADIIDLHWFFKQHVDMLVHDGVHWNGEAHRRVTNILLTHLCAAWDISLPPLSLMAIPVQPSTSSSRSGDKTGSSRERSRGHQRCNSLPDMVFSSTSGRSQYDQNNNTKHWQASQKTSARDSNNNNNISRRGSRLSKGEETMAQMTLGMDEYTSEYGDRSISASQEYWNQRAYVGAMRQHQNGNGSYGQTKARNYGGFS